VIRSDCDAISSWVIWESLSDEFKSAWQGASHRKLKIAFH
jgi:hypothetical protein